MKALTSSVLLLGILAASCGRTKPEEGSDTPILLPATCGAEQGPPPSDLACTGLYSDIIAKVIAPGVAAYAPAVPLWSDGAEKNRWIQMPADGVIDNSDPNEWIFPVGTKLWKEFSMEGVRVETRLWQKVSATYWVDGTYVWNADESAAVLSGGGDIPLPSGALYHVPTGDECQKCHRGRTDHILGFDQVLLGLPGAVGVTLDALTQQGLLTNPPASTTLVVGDDGTGAAAPALAWLHVNCGTTCHNGNSNATAYGAGMSLRLDPTWLDGRSLAAVPSLTTTVAVPANAPSWNGSIRIVPGSPEQSLLYQLITQRGTGLQMPPIATRIADDADDALVGAWIAAMPGLPAPAVPTAAAP